MTSIILAAKERRDRIENAACSLRPLRFFAAKLPWLDPIRVNHLWALLITYVGTGVGALIFLREPLDRLRG